MYIKQISIQGFKSYKNETVIDLLSPHHNVVVGRNGSGKSNFFAAIRFVLSDAYTNISREERQSLIHEGSGTVMSAYVEIVFDNTDHRLPIPKDEVAIRRTIGMKKDDYSLNSRSVTKSDIVNLLESAGFSRSNPYYIVPQGRVTAITNFKDAEKLELLKEVSGAKVFEKKLADSEKEMTAAVKKQEQIDEMLRYIQSRLDDLDMERDDLKSFEKYNNEKKVLEYSLLDREIRNLGAQIDGIDTEYTDTVEGSASLVTNLNEGEKKYNQLQDKLSDLKSNRKLVAIDRDENVKELEDICTKLGEARATLKTVQLEEASATGGLALKAEQARQAISEKEEQLAELKPELQELTTRQKSIRSELKQLKLDQRSLLSKRGRSHQFSSQAQRDNWLNGQINSVNELIESKQNELNELSSTQNTILDSKKAKVSERDALALQENEQILALERSHAQLKQECSTLIDSRKQLWREESKLNSIISTYEGEKARCQEDLSGSMDSSISKGLEAVQRIAKKLGISGVYGPLGELIDVSEKYKTAVEVVGGNAIFNVVVNNDRTASLIMDQLIAEKAGRVTFMPLNRLHARESSYPGGDDSVPLIRKISYDEDIAPAVQQIFGNTVVCLSLERGAELANAYGVGSVTLDGDVCNTSGVLSGGFREQTKSRVDALKNISKWNTEIASVTTQLSGLKDQIAEKDREIMNANEAVNKQRKELDAKLGEQDAQQETVVRLDADIAACDQELKTLDSRSEAIEDSIPLLQNQVKEYNTELASEFNKKPLTDDEEATLAELETRIPELNEEYVKCQEKVASLEVEYSAVESELDEKLRPLYRRLTLRSSKKTRTKSHKVDDINQQIDSLNTSRYELEENDAELQEKLKSIDGDIEAQEEEIRSLDESQKALVRKLENYSKTSEKSLGKKLALCNRRDDINKKINNLGLLPDNSFDEYTNASSTDILRQLNEVNGELKRYNHVNKKALEQYLSFMKQKESLVSRRTELDTAKESIEELISVLQGRKNAAIIKTFREVSTNFTEVFEKLVPAGTGRLIIQKRNEQQVESLTQALEPDDMDIDHDAATDSYVGVTIAVSFGSKQEEQQRIEQLSGGQKSLCALALILAIQGCDPAPFYLFDEIDANLDAQYRTSVANLVHELSKDAQFICTTFRPEMVDIADKFFGVMFINKVSSVVEITKEEALGFVDLQHN